MTRWLTIGLVLVLALAATARAQINRPDNELGVYTAPDPVGCATAQVDVAAGGQFTAYVVLTNPWNAALDRPVSHLGGVEFRVEWPAGLAPLGMVWPPGTEAWPAWDGDAVEFLAGFMIPPPVVDGSLTIVRFLFMASTADPGFIYLRPVALAPASIPGSMAYTDYDDGFSLQAMAPVSGSPDVPVFAINWDGDLSFCETVPDANASFGSVKALYR